MPNQLSVVGLHPDDEARVRSLVARMAPTKLPQNGIAFLDGKTYNKMRSQVENGEFGGQRISQAGSGGDERFGGSFTQSRTNLGDAFTLGAIGRVYVNADALKHPDKLAGLLAHELGHINAGDTEGAADQQKAVYLQRAQQAQKMDAAVQQLPPTAHAILSGALRGMAPQPESPLQTIAGNSYNK